MVFAGSFIKCIDNTGAKVLEVLEVSGYPKHVPGYAGDEIKVIVHHGISGRKARIGFRYRALIVQCSSSVARPFGETVKGRNLAVLLRHDENIPLGNRFSRRYAFFREVKEKGWLRVSLLASKFILK